MDIWPALKNEKMDKVASIDKDEERIYVNHVTIRQSIFFLLLKLLVLEVLAGTGLITFYTTILSPRLTAISNQFYNYVVPFLIIMVVIKIGIMVFVVIQWLEEYYEINVREVVHRRGLIFRREERFTLKHLGTITLIQGTLGSIFHYGTISLYDWVNGEHIHLYLIHNPRKYHKILQSIVPEADKEKRIFRQHVIEPGD
jgi:hypothetical protein